MRRKIQIIEIFIYMDNFIICCWKALFNIDNNYYVKISQNNNKHVGKYLNN